MSCEKARDRSAVASSSIANNSVANNSVADHSGADHSFTNKAAGERVHHSQVHTLHHWLGLCVVGLLMMGCSTSNADTVANTDTVANAEKDPTPPLTRPEQSTRPGKTSLFNNAQILPVGATTDLGGVTIDLEVTRNLEEQAKGLMFRERLPDDRGMLFSFDPPRIARFWMKDVVIDLDMVFLYEGEIVEIAADVPPCASEPCPTYGPVGKLVDTVIELRGGRAAELGLKRGDAVVIETLSQDG